jgi:hypothetical protein
MGGDHADDDALMSALLVRAARPAENRPAGLDGRRGLDIVGGASCGRVFGPAPRLAEPAPEGDVVSPTGRPLRALQRAAGEGPQRLGWPRETGPATLRRRFGGSAPLSTTMNSVELPAAPYAAVPARSAVGSSSPRAWHGAQSGGPRERSAAAARPRAGLSLPAADGPPPAGVLFSIVLELPTAPRETAKIKVAGGPGRPDEGSIEGGGRRERGGGEQPKRAPPR